MYVRENYYSLDERDTMYLIARDNNRMNFLCKANFTIMGVAYLFPLLTYSYTNNDNMIKSVVMVSPTHFYYVGEAQHENYSLDQMKNRYSSHKEFFNL